MFLDIYMPFVTGLELLEKLGDEAPVTVIVTAHPKYAIEGYRFSVADYLLKPLTYDRFMQAVGKAEKMISAQRMLAEHVKDDTLTVKTTEGMVCLHAEDIEYIESMQNYVAIHLSGGGCHLAHKTMSAIQDELSGETFVRIHRKYIINMKKAGLLAGSSIEIGGQRLPVAGSRRKEVEKFFDCGMKSI